MYPYPASAGAPVAKRRRVWPWIAGAVAVLAVVSTGTAVAVYQVVSPADADSAVVGADDAAHQLAKAMEDGELSDAEWEKMDSSGVFFAVLKTAAQQRVVNTLRWDRNESAEDAHRVYNVTFDWQSKEIAYEYQSHREYPGGLELQYHRCVDGVMYDRVDHYEAGQGEWEESTVPDASVVCDNPTRARVGTTDGVNTGGLSGDEADTFTSAVAERDIIDIKDDEVVEVDGKRYVRLAMELTPVLDDRDGQYYGIKQLMWAFQETGVDPNAHPYAIVGAGKQGLRMIMYVDPVTVLPAYSQSINTPGLNSQGGWLSDEASSEHPGKVQYSYVDEVPKLDLDNDEVHEFDWEEEDFPPTSQDWKP